MMTNTHRANCANAQGPGCKCSGCGGSQHGWQGWTSLAADRPEKRDDRRRELEEKVEEDRRSGRQKFNAHNREIYFDLARLDIADYLWAADGRTRINGRLPRDVEPTSMSSDLGRMDTLAHQVMENPWYEISAGIDSLVRNKADAREVKRRLADHTWCSLLAALIQLIERINKAVDLLSDTAKQFITGVLSQRFNSGLPRLVTDAVIRLVVDKVWSALARLLEAHFPLLGTDTLRALRMLAMFACPWVEHHPEVYKHAVRPLMGDAHGIITDEIKTQVVTLFTAWWRRRAPEALA
ncbi:hypothetical protein AMK25_25010 [Micromonospora sp. TSRI0369]|uniref:hypothetical protein n=1 Tax=Micromonospora sp. TSRI0369 TaxID=1703936 RepID=UPI00093AA46E|nr:hypothetical protein [Micromonospora sp. TSRI0369]OKJ39850.1 hypothetical protein AMK25_25010 [Micromonospora sp. TSRI0369]